MKEKKEKGRPTKYDPKYCQEIIEYFSVDPFEEKVMEEKKEFYADGSEKSVFEKKVEVAAPMRFINQFARSIGVNQDTLHEWASKHPSFSEAFTRAKELQHEMIVINSLKGLYDSRYAIFATTNMTHWRQKQEIAVGVEDETFEKYKELSIEQIKIKLAGLLGAPTGSPKAIEAPRNTEAA